MKTFTELKDQFKDQSSDSSSNNDTRAKRLINDGINKIAGKADWNFLVTTATRSFSKNQEKYIFPEDLDKLIALYYKVGSTIYTPEEINSRRRWERLTSSTDSNSDTPEYVFITNDEFILYPKPSSDNTDAITIVYRQELSNLSVEDYTTGNVTDISNGDTTVTGSGTSWVNRMEGRYLQIPKGNTSDTGDGRWYEIDTVNSATELDLRKPYQGKSLSGASASYTIGEITDLPKSYQDLPLQWALYTYFSSVKPNQTRAEQYQRNWKDGINQLEQDYLSKTTSPVIEDGLQGEAIENPNNYPRI